MANTKLKLVRFNKKRNRKFDIQLTALIDIVVFLLVFLIQLATISKINLNLQSNIHLPSSQSLDDANRGITVQITKDMKVYVADELIPIEQGEFWSPNNIRLIYQKIKDVKTQMEEVIKKTANTERFDLVLNLAMDKSLSYINIKNLMDLSLNAGVTQFKFIVVE